MTDEQLNYVTVPVGADGAIRIYNGGMKPVDGIADLDGTYNTYPSH